MRGEFYFKHGRYHDAVQDLNRSIQLDAKNVYALMCRAACHRSLDQIIAALLDYDAVLQIDPSYTWNGTTPKDSLELIAKQLSIEDTISLTKDISTVSFVS